MGQNSSMSKRQKLDNHKAVVVPATVFNAEIRKKKTDDFGVLLNKTCWERVLSFVTDPNDLHSLSNLGSTRLDEVLKKRKISASFLLVLPILMRNQDLILCEDNPNTRWTAESILLCRQLNKACKRTIDECLEKGICQELFQSHVFSCSTPHQIQTFELQAVHIINGNPFILSHLKMNARHEQNCEPGLQLLQNRGNFLQRLTLLNFLDNLLAQALSHTPNIKCLTIFSGLNPRDLHGNSLELTLPPLPRLEHIWFELYEHRRKRYGTVAPWTRSFLLAYGLQLKTLHCDHSMFLSGISWETFSSSLANLEELKVNWLDPSSGPLFEILSKVNWSKLKRLYLNEWFGEAAEFSKFSLKVLQNFRTSLEDLNLPKFVGQSWAERLQSLFEGQNEMTHLPFPHLKRIGARESNVDSPMWSTFSASFNNVECLQFELDSRDNPYSPVIPSKNTMEKFFSSFVKLEYILWPKENQHVGSREYIAYMRNGKSYQVYENRKNQVFGFSEEKI